MTKLLAMIPGSRNLNLLIFVACTSMILIALYMEHVMLLQPCGLCITQRVFVILTGLVCLAAAIHKPSPAGVRNYALLAASMCVAGGYFAGRQIWLQHLPEDQVPACGPGLDYMLEQFPLAQVIKQAFIGTGECAAVDWTLFSLSIAEWSLICFSAITLVYVALMWSRATAERRLF